jgi:CubicO group peptidase (beta-lactamase class C family)
MSLTRVRDNASPVWVRPGVSGDAPRSPAEPWRTTEIGGGGTAMARSNRKHAMSTCNPPKGHAFPGFEAVREEFVRNLISRREFGGGCSAYHRGDQVVDLWGGIRNTQTGAPWEQDTMVLLDSATEGLAAMTLAIAHSRGWLDYDERVAAYWPEFGQHGKERVTVRQLLAHQAGLFALDEPVDGRVLSDRDQLARILARQGPAWEPGTRQGYHGLTLGYYEG